MEMRTMSTDGLRNLNAKGSRGPWLIDEGHLLRTSDRKGTLSTEGRAGAVFDIYRVASEAGALTPVPYMRS